jgi:DNA-binding LytR/AlgR family response regulator
MIKMRAIIVEDEILAADNLFNILVEVGNIQVISVLDSVFETINWFNKNPEPDILFLDIHLADGSAFEIFEKVQINCPIVFTTSYDEYALKAFKVNSIDYLLKPLVFNEVKNSIDKLSRLTTFSERKAEDLSSIVRYFKERRNIRSNFLIPAKGDKLIPLNTDKVMYFYIDSGIVKAVTDEGRSYTMDKTLDDLSEVLDPHLFFRVNRQFIISHKSIKDMDLWFNQRLSLNLNVSVPEKIIISKAKIQEFKLWFTDRK